MKKYDKYLLAIILIGFGLRMLYVYVVIDILFPFENNHFTGDSASYIDSIINLIQHGSYCFDLKNPESYFGRLPGYPAFIGLHYLILGKDYFIEGVLFSQILIDTTCIYLIYRIVKKLTLNEKSALLGAFLYATFPFIVTWPATISTENTACFAILLWLYFLIYKTESRYYVLGAGLLCAFCFFMRSYLGILMPVTVLYFFFYHAPTRGKIRSLGVLMLGFMMLYIWWPVRNYVNHDRIILIKPATAGYVNMASDVSGFMNFYQCFSNDDNKWIRVIRSEKTDVFPDYVFDSPADKKLANELLVMGRQCGSGFRSIRGIHTYPHEENCNDTIAQGFSYLTGKFISNHPGEYFTIVPLQNILKAFFKHEVESEIVLENSYIKLCFLYRSIIIIAGFVALLVLRKNKYVISMGAYVLFIFGYICFYFRSLEMRYLIQADIFLLICTTLLIDYYFISKRYKTADKAETSGQDFKLPAI